MSNGHDHKAEKKACVCYSDSKFLGHATANGPLASFNEIINTMDGPSTNWKLFELVQKH